MSIDRIMKSVLVALILAALLYFVGANFLGPGVGDFSTPIANGYEYNDSGGYEKNIIYTGDENNKKIVIDSRVDNYRLNGDKLFVARRPREVYRVDDIAKSRLSENCEYWVIDTETHVINQIPDSHGLQCN